MTIEEAIKILKQEPDFSLRYYIRENAIDVLLTAYEKLQKEIEEKYISIDRMTELIAKHKKFLFDEFSHYDENDIENRKAIQYASARLTFLLEDIYKLKN